MDKKAKEALREQGRNIALIEIMGNEILAELYDRFREMMREMQRGYLEEMARLQNERVNC